MGEGVTVLSPVKVTGVGLPDYSTAAPIGNVPQGFVNSVSDIGELAARMGGPDIYDRRGNVIFVDNFEDGINNYTYALGAGAGSAAVWTHEQSASGGYCLKLYGGLGTASSFTRQWATLNMDSNMGLEVSIAMPAFPNFPQLLTIMVVYNDGTTQHNAGARFDNTLGQAFYYNSAGLWVLGNQGAFIPTGGTVFSNLKAVLNLKKNKYVRLMFNQNNINIDYLYSQSLPFLSIPYAYVTVTAQSSPGINSYAYFDNIIITVNEPDNS